MSLFARIPLRAGSVSDRTSVVALPSLATIAFALLLVMANCATAQQNVGLVVGEPWPGAIRLPIGVTKTGRVIHCIVDREALEYHPQRRRVLVVSGLDATFESVAWATFTAEQIVTQSSDAARPLVAVISVANPEESKGMSTAFPPQGAAYNSDMLREAAVLWRFVGWFAPDLVIEVHSSTAPEWQTALEEGKGVEAWPAGSLAAAVQREPVATMGTVPSMRIVAFDMKINLSGSAQETLRRYQGRASLPLREVDVELSPAHVEASRRAGRSPVAVLEELTKVYGRRLSNVSYQPALAVMAQLRLDDLTGSSQGEELVTTMLMPYLTGQTSAFPKRYGGSQLAGHLVFADWAQRTGDERAVELVVKAANHAFDEVGNLREVMPFHNEMSDAVFMSGPLLTSAWRLTGDERYLTMAERHVDFMQEKCLREDGIYRHSPLCETAWGRGNGFPALGLALAISDLDLTADEAETLRSPLQARLLERFKQDLHAHLDALLQHQDPTGMWRQVIDHPGSYRELTSTCMIGFALARALRRGWIEGDRYEQALDRAWQGVALRCGPDGQLFDVCTGTGKQRDEQAYLERTAILGKDERGGAMAMTFAAEMAARRNTLPASKSSR